MRIMLLPSQDQDIWSLACSSGLLTLHHWFQNIRVEIDASYIKGMLNNPDIQPGAAVNRWIIGIKLFQFELVHVPGHLHTGLDGLSHCAASPNNLINEDEDADNWLDRTMSFAVVIMNSRPSWSSRLNSSYHPTRDTSYRP